MKKTLIGHHVLLRAGSLRLLLPQASVGAAEYREFEPTATAQAGVFEMVVAGKTRRVIFPSQRLRPLGRVDTSRFVLTRLHVPIADEFWFAWDEVRVFVGAGFAVYELPPALREGPAMPATRYIELNEELVLCADAADVVAYLCNGLEVMQ